MAGANGEITIGSQRSTAPRHPLASAPHQSCGITAERSKALEKLKRILIADIDGDLLTRLEVLFEDRGYPTTTAWGGREAIRLLESRQFDLVLLSDYLPDVNSEEVWRAIERLPVCPSVAILKTTQPVKETEDWYQHLGGRCALSKASPYKIVESVDQCLRSGESYPLHWQMRSQTASVEADSVDGSTPSAE